MFPNEVIEKFGSEYRIEYIPVSKKGYPKITRGQLINNQIIIKNRDSHNPERYFFLLTKF